MELVEHRFRVCLERLREQIVQIHFVCLINARNRDRAPIAGATHPCGRALCILRSALCLNGRCCLSLRVCHLSQLPVLEGGMACGELCDPDTWASNHFLVHTVLKVFLLMRVKEQVKTGKVTEADEFGQGASLLVSERLEQFVVQVANLLLCD